MTGTSELLRRWPTPTAFSVCVWFESLAELGQQRLKSIGEADKGPWRDLGRDLQLNVRPEFPTRDLSSSRPGRVPHLPGQFGRNELSETRYGRTPSRATGTLDTCSSWWSNILPGAMSLQALDLTGALFRHHPDREQISGHSFLPVCLSSHNFLPGRGSHCRPSPKHTNNQGGVLNPSASSALGTSAGVCSGHCCLQRLAYQVCLLFCSPWMCLLQ